MNIRSTTNKNRFMQGKEERIRKKWYYQLLLSYLPVFFIATSIIVIISFVGVRLTIGNEAKRVNEVATTQMLKNIDDALRSIDHLILKEILNNVAFDKFFDLSKETDKYLDSLEMSDRIRNIIHATPLIDSLYLYRFRDQIVLTRDERIAIEQFQDKDFLAKLLQNQQQSKWSDLREVTETNVVTNETISRKVLTLTSKVPTISGELGLIVVNVRPYAIQSMIDQMANSSYSLLDFVDKNNTTIASVRDAALPQEDRLANQTHSFTIRSSYTGWSLHSSINNSEVYGFSSAIYYGYFAFWIAAIAAGAYWIYLITRRNYKPVEALMGRLEKYKSEKSLQLLGSDKRGEFDYIEHALDHLIDRFDYQQRHVEEHVKLRQRKLLLDLLEGNFVDRNDEIVKNMLEEQGQACVIVVEIDAYEHFVELYNKHDQYLLRFVVENVCYEVSQEHGIQVWAEWVEGHQLAVLFQSRESASQVEATSRKLSQWVQDNLDFTVTIGIGSPAKSMGEVSGSYERALAAIKMKFKFGRNRVIRFNDLPETEEELIVQPKVLKMIAQSFRQGDTEWPRKLLDFVNQTTEAHAAKENVQHILQLLLFSMDREMSEVSSELRAIWKKRLLRLNEGLDTHETEIELSQFYCSELNEAYEDIKQHKDEKSHTALMHRIKEHIDKEYIDPDLTLARLGEVFQINSSYLSRTFKEEIGMNVTDYIVVSRMEKAKQLLKDTQEAVQDISVQVGYTYTMSFIRVFKKTTGLTPGEYRRLSAEA
ncbi:helix-turn-helix domain-containing protein [Paenibacillus baimaensis]|nr:helix-turn-helix domain-containing protein [Paenibacillus sp. WQ 127069]